MGLVAVDLFYDLPMKVLNKRRDKIPDDAIYVGRPTKWGNPFIIGRDGTREEVVAKYWHWITDSDQDHLDPIELYGHDLVCWCAPFACHADILLQLANEAHEEVYG